MAIQLKPDYLDDAISKSKLPSWARHLFRALAPRCDWDSGEIPETRLLSLTEMQDRTGHGRRTVREALFMLQEEGWISRLPPPEDVSRREHAKTRTWLHEPGSKLMMAVREQLTGPDHHARRRLARDRWQKWKSRHDAEIPDWAADPALLHLAARTLAEFNGGRDPGPAVAAAAVTTVLGGHARSYFRVGAARYLTESLRKDPRRFLPVSAPAAAPPPPPPVDTAAAQDAAAAGAAAARRRLADRPRPGAPP